MTNEIEKLNENKLINKIYEDGLSESVKVIGTGIATCLKFIGSSIEPTMYKYIKNAEYKKEQISIKLKEKYDKIRFEDRIDPRISILGPSVELLKYNLDENYIKEMIVNLLTSEMDSNRQSNVLPSYIDIIRQLSFEDALALEKIYNLYKINKIKYIPLICIEKILSNKNQFDFISNHFIIENYSNTTMISNIKEIIINNLCRLGLINYNPILCLPESESYETGLMLLKSKYKDNDMEYEKSCIEITQYGIEFLKICFD